MRICIPIEEDHGLQSHICAHFGGAPAFLVVDTESGDHHALSNEKHGAHGRCAPITALERERVEGVLVSGIGRGALHRLSAASVRVYRVGGGTVREALRALQAGDLPPMDGEHACAGHDHDDNACGADDGRGHRGHGRGAGAAPGHGSGGRVHGGGHGHGSGEGRGRWLGGGVHGAVFERGIGGGRGRWLGGGDRGWGLGRGWSGSAWGWLGGARGRAQPGTERPPKSAEPTRPAATRAPELAQRIVAALDSEQCTSCGACIDSCPTGALAWQDTVVGVDQSQCTGCSACIVTCPNGALTLTKVSLP